MMNISVIVPVLNEEKSIAAMLRAACRPLQPFETIVVDGGSRTAAKTSPPGSG
jgi:glycosyltransferase involved in cell wall biosynthesis